MGLKNLFFWLRSHLGNDDMISENGYGFSRSGLKTGVENDIFWSEIGSGFREQGGIPPPRISRGTPRAFFTPFI